MEVTMREFKSHLAQYISKAQSGELIELTSHRKVVARLAGVLPPDGTAASRLLAAGAATWQGGKPTGATLAVAPKGTPVSRMVLDDRG